MSASQGSTSLGVGMVGAGLIAQSHAAAVTALPGVHLAAVFDPNAGAAQGFSRQYGSQISSSFADLLADPDVAIVVLGTPNDTHTELALATAEAGKHLLLEKPLALSVADAQLIVDTFAAKGLTVLVGHTHRHSDYARAVRQAVQSGAIGTPRSMRISVTGGWIWAGWNAWVLRPERSGGHAFHNGVHLYDLAHWWMGSPAVRAYALGQKLTSAALQIDDSLTATLELANGASAVCEISRGERPKNSSLFEIVIHGSTGTLVRRWTSDGLTVVSDEFSGPVGAAGTSPFARQFAVLRDAITNGAPVFPDLADAVHAIAIAEAVEASAQTGEVTAVPSTQATSPENTAVSGVAPGGVQ